MNAGLSWSAGRTIVLDNRAAAAVDQASEDFERFGQLWEGIEWLLARKPETGMPRQPKEPSDYLIYVCEAREEAGTPSVWVLYSYDDDEVEVHAVKVQ